MRIDLINQSKYRTGSKVGDDVPLILPGQVFGIFDGATDPRGTIVDGIGAGRLAALTAAQHTSEIAARSNSADLSTEQIIHGMSAALAKRTNQLKLPIPPSTTLALALDCKEYWRFIVLGDSGIRLNNREVLRHEKTIDDVSTSARVAIFNLLKDRSDDLDQIEISTRRAIFLGLDHAIETKMLDRPKADDIIAHAIAATNLDGSAQTVKAFLNGGIQTQFRYGNTTDSVLSFDTLNSTQPTLQHVVDVCRAKDEVETFELFSDGYPKLPSGSTLNAWEQAFHHVESVDFHKTGPFASVKGATSEEFFDDRTVLILSAL